MEIIQTSTPTTYSLEPCHDNLPVHGVRFNQSYLASIGFDGSIHFWSLNADYENIAILKCSKRPLLQLDFYNKGKNCAAACADGVIYLVDSEESFSLIGVLKGHDSYVNGICSMGENGLASSSDDYTVKLWDVRDKKSTCTIDLNREATSICYSEQLENQIFVGSLDNLIRCYDPRNVSSPILSLQGHKDMVTGLNLSFDGRELLSSAVDGSLCIWDAAPFSVREDRLVQRIPHGIPAGESVSDRSLLRCTWTPDGRFISAGSGSGSSFVVCMWNRKGQPHKAFPGHQGFVIEVAFHPTENLIASCGMDGKLLIGSYL